MSARRRVPLDSLPVCFLSRHQTSPGDYSAIDVRNRCNLHRSGNCSPLDAVRLVEVGFRTIRHFARFRPDHRLDSLGVEAVISMSTHAERQPECNYSRHWSEIRRRRRLLFCGPVLAIFLPAILGGTAVISEGFSHTLSGILFICTLIAMLTVFVGMMILYFWFIRWPCPRCGQPYFGKHFGWFPIRDLHWSKIESCVHCGLLVDSPNAGACPDRRDVRK